MSKRGVLTDEIQVLAKMYLDRKISRTELRLMPYIQHVMMNEQKLDPRKINEDERKILRRWKDEGHIEGGACGLSITKEFWDAMSSILWVGYVVGAADNVPEITLDKSPLEGE